jgi:hydroxymethylglutaryl-CoA lyase
MPRAPEHTPRRVTVLEVGPRDGLQNERVRLSTDEKVDFVSRLVKAGFRHIEVGSFVHPKWIPQMADTAEVLRRLPKRDDVAYWTLVPNRHGFEAAVAAEARHIAVFLSSSETHNRKNLNRTIDESLEGIEEITVAAASHGMKVRGYVSTVFGCPYEGPVDFDRVLRIADRLLALGCFQVSLGDTTGMGTPFQVREGSARALKAFGSDRIALHLHDTRGTGLANALAGLEVGITHFDSSVGGMGGCPYAPGASGNLGTEDLLYVLQAAGIETGIDLDQLLSISQRLEFDHGATLNSRYYRYRQTGRPTAWTR